jgi:hypothetical protein
VCVCTYERRKVSVSERGGESEEEGEPMWTDILHIHIPPTPPPRGKKRQKLPQAAYAWIHSMNSEVVLSKSKKTKSEKEKEKMK